jgi:hypothetical protein
MTHNGIPRSALAIATLIFGTLVVVAGLCGYMILIRVHWVGWEGIVAVCAIIMCGGTLLVTGWNLCRVLRE